MIKKFTKFLEHDHISTSMEDDYEKSIKNNIDEIISEDPNIEENITVEEEKFSPETLDKLDNVNESLDIKFDEYTDEMKKQYIIDNLSELPNEYVEDFINVIEDNVETPIYPEYLGDIEEIETEDNIETEDEIILDDIMSESKLGDEELNLIKESLGNDFSENEYNDYMSKVFYTEYPTYDEYKSLLESSDVLDHEVTITEKDIENIYKYFHLSSKRLDGNNEETFKFTKRKPRDPYEDGNGDIIEDDFTKRVSLGSSIIDCCKALPYAGGFMYLYAIDLKKDNSDNIETLSMKDMLKHCPVGYGEMFDMKDWILNLLPEEDRNIILKHLKSKYPDINLYDVENYDSDDISFIHPGMLPEKYKKMFYACVPDADRTNEFWTLDNIEMQYIGEYNIDTGELYIDTESPAYQIIKNNADL